MSFVPSSNSPPDRPLKGASPSPRRRRSTESSPPHSATEARPTEEIRPELSLEATEPFPPGLFRMPVPDRVFAEMPEMSDSALRALLALIRLSFRYDPEESTWTRPDRTFTRSAVEAECGLSAQGTRNGLGELEEAGYIDVDRSGRCHEHSLEMEVPSACYTYLPTGLFEEAPGLTGTELRLVLTVLRATWGWTTRPSETEHGSAPEHRRWARLSTETLARRTGRSQVSVKKAARGLQGGWLRRRRPSGGAYHYRFHAEALSAENDFSKENDFSAESKRENRPDGRAQIPVETKARGVFSMGLPRDSSRRNTSNDLPPDRQQSYPPRRGTIERSLENPAKHKATSNGEDSRQETPPNQGETPAVPKGENPSGDSARRPRGGPQAGEARPKRGSHRGPGGEGRQAQGQASGEVDLTGFCERKRQLGQKLANVGVWPRRIPDLLGRFSAERIEANFQLYRKRAQQVKKSGAWLAAAIEGGFALPSPGGPEGTFQAPEEPSTADSANGLPQPGTKVSEARRRELLKAGLATEEDFDRFADYDDPAEKQHFYRVDKGPSPAVG